jgi:DNA mismatch repair protein MutS2
VDERTLRVLEFPKIRERLASQTLTAGGRARADALQPSADPADVTRNLAVTTEGVALVADGEVPLRGTSDIGELLHRARIGSVLQPADLQALRDTVAVMRQCKGYILARQERAPVLAEVAHAMGTFESLETAIRRTIADDGSILDSASADLSRLRREQRTAHTKIRDKLDELLRGPSARMLQDPLISTRGDRYVVPVRQEFKGVFPGVLHDQSSSGATVFMEPLAIVPLGNQVRELQIAEREEIIRLLRELTAQVAAVADPIGASYDALGDVDLAVAKAELAEVMRATAPRVRSDGTLRLRQARHPLLGGEVVPIDVWLGDEFTTLIITGPNTGGKTVTLKTIGLLTLMAQSGLHIPADEGAEINVFAQVFADVGDEQSIEQSLSTFSSHMSAIVGILAQLDESGGRAGGGRGTGPQSALVLLDEIGAGTDPTEGVVLARALIEHLHRLGTRTAVTTHYNELKALAYSHPGIQNASVEFDAQTLRPTYRLLIGVPGRSNALDIAGRLGLSGPIVARARELLGPEVGAIDRILSDIEADRRAYEYELAEASRHRQEANVLQTRAAQELERLRAERTAVLTRLREDADALLRQARGEVEAVIATLKAATGPQAIQEARSRLRKLAEELVAKAQPETVPEGEPLTAVLPGQSVYVVPLNRVGTVLVPGDARGEVEVEAGTLRVKVHLSSLRAAPNPSATTRPWSPHLRDERQRREQTEVVPSVPLSLSLRGMTVDEALPLLDKYLDDAVVAGLPRVTVVHGKGTGALRKAVHGFLRTHPHVKQFRLGERGEGESGVTIVELHTP